MELFDLPLSESSLKLISENTEIVNKNIARWILAEKSIQSDIAQRVLDALSFAKRRHDIGQKKLKISPERRSMIEELVRRGNNMAQFNAVIEFKIVEWKGTVMEGNITPETLFNKKKFPKYLDAARDNYKKGEKGIKTKPPTQNQYEQLMNNDGD